MPLSVFLRFLFQFHRFKHNNNNVCNKMIAFLLAVRLATQLLFFDLYDDHNNLKIIIGEKGDFSDALRRNSRLPVDVMRFQTCHQFGNQIAGWKIVDAQKKQICCNFVNFSIVFYPSNNINEKKTVFLNNINGFIQLKRCFLFRSRKYIIC